jgi:integrase
MKTTSPILKKVATADAPRKPGRPRSGRVETFRTERGSLGYMARVRLADGSSTRIEIEKVKSLQAARSIALDYQNREDTSQALLRAKGVKLAPGGETTGEWFARFCASRSHLRDQWGPIYKWRKNIGPLLDEVPIAAIAREDIERVRDHLDIRIREGLHPKTAQNAWNVLTIAMKTAVRSKVPGLRCRDTNPCTDVQRPDGGESRYRPWLYPCELTTLLECEAVPLAIRRVYAIAAYMFTRPGETAGLMWADVEFATQSMMIRRSYDWVTRSMRPPKTRSGLRRLPIHDNLLPLLLAMRGAPSDRVWPEFEKWDHQRGGVNFRKHLMLAGVTRAELHEGDEQTMPADFRSLRTSGGTWAVLAGIQGLQLERRLGHADGETVKRYVAVAENVRLGAIGNPFCPLPACLVSTLFTPTRSGPTGQLRETIELSSWSRGGSNP